MAKRPPGRDVLRIRKQVKASMITYNRGLKLEMFRALTILEAEIKSNIRKNFTIRSGRLLNSIQKRIEEMGNEIKGTIGPEDVPYAALQEFGSAGLPGGVIRPKKSKFLAIPTENVKGPDGIARFSPRDLRKPSFIPIRSGGFLMGIRGTRGSFTPMFVLKKQVEVPARPYLRPALESKRAEIEKRFGIFLQDTFEFGG